MTLSGGVGGNSLTTSPAYFHGVNAVTGAGDQLRPDVSEKTVDSHKQAVLLTSVSRTGNTPRAGGS